jgi:copper homeostasis protein (lipoprotein)
LSTALRLLLLAAAFAAVVGCQRQQDDAPAPAAEARVRPPEEAPEFGGERTWQGVLPCSDCLGIDTRLVLRQDGNRRSYVLEETYLGASEPNRFEREGRWVEMLEGSDDAAGTVYVLDPDRAPRRFRLQPDGGVELLTGGGAGAPAPEYRLQRL